ncbi:MAG: AIR synthase [Aphanocapsa feldmannii 277cV]|uniref:AIR synthase n=2 Tax=Aphanocapsa feldmannii TaxID=192050 RepID=A0A524RLL0_9CHRO|nr:MAG: AIR synthase [Aphanocapsa feldmannii 288cV]TGG90964.1 MAG: AIR synthase [Aphanocapsa feldmannii 277cV]
MTSAASFQLSAAAAAELCRQAAQTQRHNVATLALHAGDCAAWVLDVRPGIDEGIAIARGDGITLHAAACHLEHIRGLSLDYRGDLRGGGFVLQGPADVEICACGAAFSPAHSH